MGIVYKARDPQLDRLVAIKMIIGATPALLKRFDVEARSTARLQHQNIVTIYDFGNQEGNPYLVMEYLEGMSLESVISSGRPLSLAYKLGICVGICSGLNYAHEHGIMHRDIKPANVMLLHDDNVKIVDFGIARIGDTGISRTEVVGSLHYMSPEQFQNTPLDSRTDIFSTGVVLYRLLTGALPFQATGEAAVMYRIIHETPGPVSSYAQNYPPELDSILEKALAKNRENRYSSCRDLAFDLQIVQEQQKHTEVLQWLHQADAAMQRKEWTKAEDYLKQLLNIEKNHTKAHHMMGEVRERVNQQRRVEQSRHLRTQADEAFLDHRYDDALTILAQAIGLDGSNKDLLYLRESIQEAKSRAVRLHSALRQAEVAQQAGDLDEAKRAVSEALELDPDETSAKALQLVILRQAEERDRQQKLRKLLDHARDLIEARDVTRAFETLKSAESIDPASFELQSLLRVANAVREQQMRKAELQRLTRQIEEAVAQEDYETASAVANEALQRNPQDQGLLKLKALSEAEQRRVKLMRYAREQFVLANGLLEVGRTFDALSVLEKALQKLPGESQLESLRSIIKNRLTLEEAEQHKRSVLGRAREVLRRNELEEGIRLLEAAQEQFPGTSEIEDLLVTARKAGAREKLVGQVTESAQRLFSQKGPEAAAKFLEKQVQVIPDPRVQAALTEARRQSDQLRQRIQNSLEEAQRILREHGTQETKKYLEAQPAHFLELAEFQTLADLLRQREACENLDRELVRQSDPDGQVRLAEEAARRNPGNAEIQSRLATTRKRKQEVETIIERAGTLEGARQYSEAVQQLSLLRQLHPRYPNLESEIQRLQRLAAQQRTLAAKLATSETAKKELAPYQAANDSLATRILEPGSAETEVAPPSQAELTRTADLSDALDLRFGSTLGEAPRSRNKWLLIGCAVVVLIAGAGLVWILVGSRAVTVYIQTTPPATFIAVDSQPCPNPCAPNLSTGSHTVEAQRVGFLPLTQKIDVRRDGPASFTVPLTPEPVTPPVATGGRIAVQANVEGADVLIDGELVGMTEGDHRFVVRAVVPGNHLVTARKQGYLSTKLLDTRVAENQQVELSFNLVVEKGPIKIATEQYLVVQSLPGAQIDVDQLPPESIPPSGELSVKIAPGLHSLEVKKDGYEVWQQQREVKPGARLPVLAELKAIPKPAVITDSRNPPTPPIKFPQPTVSLSVSPKIIKKGDTAELRWETRDADQVWINDKPVERIGFQPITPADSQGYRLVAKNPGATAIIEVEVVVTQPPASEPHLTPDDEKSITALLNGYAQSYVHKDKKKVHDVWPGIDNDTFKMITKSYDVNETMEFQNLQFFSEPDNIARVVCTQRITYDGPNGRVGALNETYKIYVVKRDGRWWIENIPFNGNVRR
jgi:hypothetical protein